MSVRTLSISAVLATTLFTTGCALQARSDIDPKATLAQCHSYSFGAPMGDRNEPAYGNPLNDKRLRDAIAEQLQVHGIQPVDGDGGDCRVRYSIGTRLEVEPGSPRFSWGMGWGWGRRGFGSLAWDSPAAYREGRVSVDLFDARSHEALWHAYVNDDVTRLTGDDADKRIRAAVAAIFARFPKAGTPL